MILCVQTYPLRWNDGTHTAIPPSASACLLLFVAVRSVSLAADPSSQSWSASPVRSESAASLLRKNCDSRCGHLFGCLVAVWLFDLFDPPFDSASPLSPPSPLVSTFSSFSRFAPSLVRSVDSVSRTRSTRHSSEIVTPVRFLNPPEHEHPSVLLSPLLTAPRPSPRSPSLVVCTRALAAVVLPVAAVAVLLVLLLEATLVCTLEFPLLCFLPFLSHQMLVCFTLARPAHRLTLSQLAVVCL